LKNDYVKALLPAPERVSARAGVYKCRLSERKGAGALRSKPMTIDEIVRDIHALEADLENYECKYGILSETFYEAYSIGEEPADDAWVLDWSDRAGVYEIWLRRRQQYQDLIRNLTSQTTLSEGMKHLAARREPFELAS
jgi:hypothetical protein